MFGEKEFKYMSDTYRLISVLSLSSGLLDEVGVSEHTGVMIAVTKVFSYSKKGTFCFYSCRKYAIRCVYQRAFLYAQKGLRTLKSNDSTASEMLTFCFSLFCF